MLFTRPFLIFGFTVVLVLLGIALLNFTDPADSLETTELRFSNTQSWDTELLAGVESVTPVVGAAALRLEIPLPPENRSQETADELVRLHDLANEREPTDLAQIISEMEIGTTRFGEFTYEEIRQQKPRTARLIGQVLPEFTALVLAQKKKFDRVRPSFLDPTLSTAIEVPEHPAYPSGHASQSHLIARILGALDPKNAAAYKDSAARIAHNRELAGLHYPSDSAAGEKLAEQYFDLLKTTPLYQELFQEAQVEWD